MPYEMFIANKQWEFHSQTSGHSVIFRKIIFLRVFLKHKDSLILALKSLPSAVFLKNEIKQARIDLCDFVKNLST